MLGNLFYRGLVLLTPVYIGDTLRTRTEVVALKQNRPRPDGSAAGLVVLRIRTENQRGEAVLDFWRCPMIPLRDPQAATGHADSFDAIPDQLDFAEVSGAVPGGWNFDAIARGRVRRAFRGPACRHGLRGGGAGHDHRRPELARLTLNVAKAHTDAGGSHHGRRLVYGGHTISVAAAHLSRALPGVATIVAWRGCDHLGPVFEGDILATTVEVQGLHELDGATPASPTCGWR